jgi:hypothetical protein
LRPVGQLGGMMYARVSETFEVPRRRWKDEVVGSEVLSELASKHEKRGDIACPEDTIEEAQKFKVEGGEA